MYIIICVFFHFHPNPKILICLKTNKKSESARKPKKSESAWKPKNLNLLEGGAWHGAVNLPLLTHLLLTSHNPLSPLFLWDQDMTCGGIMIWWLFVLMILSMILDNTKARGLVYFNLYSGKIFQENTGNKRRKIDQDKENTWNTWNTKKQAVSFVPICIQEKGPVVVQQAAAAPSPCANCKHKNPDGENNILLSSKFVSKPQERVQEKQREIGLIHMPEQYQREGGGS